MVFAVWAAPEPVPDGLAELEHALVASVRLARAEPELLAHEASERYGYPAGLPRALLREAPLLLRAARARRALHLPRDGAGRRRARPRARAPLRARTRASGEAVTSHERGRGAHGRRRARQERSTASGSATRTPSTLLRSRDLVAVGRVANEVRNRHNDPARVTFIVDRNINYTNVCYTDCDFCAFYRRPGDTREGYLLPKPVIFKKIEETLAMGGTGVLMQGGHHPDLGIDYYEDLFRSIKSRYPIHLHASRRPRCSTSPAARS